MSTIDERIANLAPEKRALLERHFLKKGISSPVKNQGICPRETTGPCALSFGQERLWFLDQLEPGSSKYNIPLAVRLSGHLHVAVLEQSFGEILRRHEVLRTTFVTMNEQPVQRIAPVTAFSLPQVDLSTLPEEQREAKARELAGDEASRSFDLTTGPLLRATLLHLAPQEHLLLVTMHHIISDGWSMGIFYRELSALYIAFSKGNPSPLPDLPVQYADFSVWQRQWLQGKKLEEQFAFWKEQLNNISTLELPTDRPRPSVQTFCGAEHKVEFSENITEALRDLGRKEGATLFMILLAAFQSLLHRYTGQENIVVGTPIANRNREEIEGLIGFFVNTLVMRTDTSGDPTFRELLKGVRKTALGAYAHQDLPFEKLVGELQPERDMSRNPLFQVIFAMQNVPFPNLEMPGLMLRPMDRGTAMSKFDLEVYVWEESERLKGSFVYNTDLFDSATIERMAGHYQRVLEGIAADPDQRLSELPLLTDAELHQLLMEWNETAVEYPRDECIHSLFEKQAARTPEAIALIFQGRQLTYRELNNKANQLAHYLRKQGVGPEVLVGICVERSMEMIIGILGILKAGGAYAPLDPTYPKERLGFMIEDTRTPVILTQRHLLNVLPDHSARVMCLDSDFKTITGESKDNPANKTAPDNLANVIYTSGSTGRPKGVCVSHRGVVRLVKETNYAELTPEEVFLQLASISFDASTFEIWGSLLNGAKLVVMPPGTPSLGELEQALLKHRITTLWLTAGLFHLMVDEKPDAFSHVRQLLAGGDVLSVSHVRRFVSKNPNCTLINGYGPTENTTFTCCHTIELSGQSEKSVPIGRPIANTRVYVLDSRLQPVPVGVFGELHTGGDGLARGYLNRPELTGEKFIPDPFSEKPEARLYKTGDLVRYLPDGNIEFLGRIDNQVKIRGFRIELAEIEAVLGQHQFVKEATVIAREDKSGDTSLAAYLVLEKKKSIANDELRQFLKEKLPEYMVPSAFVILDALPLNPNNKVDRSALPAPDNFASGTSKTFVAPRNSLEAQLTLIWEKILNTHPIGVTDNFFELGGHSLLAVRLLAEIKRVTGKNLPVIAFFQSPTVEQLVQALQKEGWSETSSFMIKIQQGGSKLPLFWMQGQYSILLSRFLDSDQPLYLPIHQGLDGGPILNRTVEEIASHYIQEIRIVQPKGPYFLGGYCLGGMVALEIAQQLLKQGDDVQLLFLVEPPRKCFPLHNHNNTRSKKFSFQSRVNSHLGNISVLQAGDKLKYILTKLPSAYNRVLRKNKLRVIEKFKILACKAYLFTGNPIPLSLRDLYLKKFDESVAENYSPKLYPGRIILCHSDLPSFEESAAHMTAGVAEVHHVRGSNHVSIVKEPYAGLWAGHLNRYLRELQAEGEEHKG